MDDLLPRLRAALWAGAAYFDDEECGRDSDASGLAFAAALSRLSPEDWGPNPGNLPWSDPYTGEDHLGRRDLEPARVAAARLLGPELVARRPVRPQVERPDVGRDGPLR
jgi:hypothetical protein